MSFVIHIRWGFSVDVTEIGRETEKTYFGKPYGTRGRERRILKDDALAVVDTASEASAVIARAKDAKCSFDEQISDLRRRLLAAETEQRRAFMAEFKKPPQEAVNQ